MNCKIKISNRTVNKTEAKNIATYFMKSSKELADEAYNKIDNLAKESVVTSIYPSSTSKIKALKDSVPIVIESIENYDLFDKTMTIIGKNLYTNKNVVYNMQLVDMYDNRLMLQSTNRLSDGGVLKITDPIAISSITSKLKAISNTQSTIKFESTSNSKINSNANPEATELLSEESVTRLIDEHSNGNKYMKEVAKELFSTNGLLNNINVEHFSNTAETSANVIFDSRLNPKNIALFYNKYDETGMDIGERYLHEVFHATLVPLLESTSSLYTVQLSKLENVYTKVLPHMTVDKLVKNGINDRLANSMIEHINEGSQGFHEFLAYAKTNEAFRKVLNEINVDTIVEPKNMMGMLMKLVKSFFSKLSSSKIDGNSKKIIDGLVTDILQIQSNNIQRSNVAKAFNKLGKVIDKFNNNAAAKIKLAEDKLSEASRVKYTKLRNSINNDGSITDKIKLFGIAISLLYSNADKAKGVFTGILKSVGMDPNGVAMQGINSFMEQDNLANEVENLGLLSQQIDEKKQSIANLISNTIHESFTTKLDWDTKEAITNIFIKTDIQSIFTKFNEITEDNIYKLLDKNKRKTMLISNISKLQDIVKNKDVMEYIDRQSDILAKYMVHGTTHIGLLKNSLQVAYGTGYKKQLDLFNNDEAIRLIDSITSLKALELTDTSKVSDLLAKDKTNVEGLTTLLKMHKEHVAKSAKELFKYDKVNVIKGYTKFIPDPNIDVVIKSISETAALKKDGYALSHMVKVPGMDGTYGLFVNKYKPKVGFNKQAVRVIDSYRTGTSVTQLLKDQLASGAISSYSEFESKRNKVLAQYDRLFDRYKRTGKDTGLKHIAPIFSTDGTVIDYAIHMDTKTKDSIYNTDNRVDNVMAGMYNTLVDKTLSNEFNTKIVDDLVDYHKEFYKEDANMLVSKDGYPIVMLGPGELASDERAKKIWGMLPSYMQKGIEKQLSVGGKPFKGLAVREDLIRPWFGEHDYNFSEGKIGKLSPAKVKRVSQIATSIWKEIVSIAKIDIVIRTPAVLVGNIMSNVMLCMQFGMSPKEVLKLQIEGVRELEIYRKDKEELDKLVLKKEVLGSSVDNQIERLQAKINRNSVKPLVDAGFFTYIMEDVNIGESKNNSTITRWVDKKLDGKPEGIKTIANYLYFTERTKPFQIMVKATQDSDFAARYAMYHANKKKIDSMDVSVKVKAKMISDLLKQTRDAFINYGKLDNVFIKYANDMGLVMFTKFLIGTQRTIKMLIKGKPVSAMLVGLSQNITGDIDDVIDHNILQYDVDKLLYNPTSILEAAATPTLFEVPSLLEQSLRLTRN